MSDQPHPGVSRSSVHADHALITPESHVPVQLPGWPGVDAIVLISAELGAKFGQLLALCSAGAALAPLADGEEYFVLVLDGQVELTTDAARRGLAADDYAYLPPATPWSLTAKRGARLLIFRKRYQSLAGTAAPALLVSRLADVPAAPFLGDEGARLQVLLPEAPAFDWGINLFEFDPGGTLPQVECHFMEHGLYVLAGQGVYRLGEHWYPVRAGDCIWMGPYLLQWYVAAGKTPSRYIYYKEMHRAPMG